MNVLVIGGGGREHALVWKIAQSSQVESIYCVPGNGGICRLATCVEIPVSDTPSLIRFAREKNVGLTVVGPEQPLADGIADRFQENGLSVFGPGREAAQMEASKIFAKRLMRRHQIPTAAFHEFDDLDSALEYIEQIEEQPLVVKADGLAAGKGVLMCSDRGEARSAVIAMLAEKQFAAAGRRLLIEECMTGPEASLFVITDGQHYLALPPAQDYKRAFDRDQGRNTGGMGSISPTLHLSGPLLERVIGEIVEPTLIAMRRENIDYRGVLYCGLMLTETGPKVVEFNCRFGDPETQVVLPRLKSDLVEIMAATVEQRLHKVKPEFDDCSAVCVVAASGGYPGAYEKGKTIGGLEAAGASALVFHAGTAVKDGAVVTSGGRVLGITGLGDTLEEARTAAYQGMGHIRFTGMHFRNDIGAEPGT